jgi:hypothetical protein
MNTPPIPIRLPVAPPAPDDQPLIFSLTPRGPSPSGRFLSPDEFPRSAIDEAMQAADEQDNREDARKS